MSQPSALRIPNFIKARSPKRLRALMFAVNRKHGMQHTFFDIQYNPEDKYWYAWFMEIIELSSAFAESEDGE